MHLSLFFILFVLFCFIFSDGADATLSHGERCEIQ